jgi:hypothetical protein
MILVILFLKAVDSLVLNSTQSFATDCHSNNNYWLDENGVLNVNNNYEVVGNQCEVQLVKFTESASRKACDPSGEDVLVIHSLWGYTYFHFVANELQRLALAEQTYNLSLFSVFHNRWAYANDMQDQWFKAAHFQAHSYTQSLPAKIRNVVIAPGIDACGSAGTRTTVSRLSDMKLSNQTKEKGTNLVWFARKSGHRQVDRQHEREVLEFVQKHFALIFDRPIASVAEVTESSSLAEIWLALNSHRSVLMVGPHGAGFTNMVLAPKESLVLEISPSVYTTHMLVQTCFMKLARICGHFYSAAVASQGTGFGHDYMRVTETSIVTALLLLQQASAED